MVWRPRSSFKNSRRSFDSPPPHSTPKSRDRSLGTPELKNVWGPVRSATVCFVKQLGRPALSFLGMGDLSSRCGWPEGERTHCPLLVAHRLDESRQIIPSTPATTTCRWGPGLMGWSPPVPIATSPADFSLPYMHSTVRAMRPVSRATIRCLTWRALALSRTSSLWARAMRTTLGGFPAARRRCWKAMKSGS